ncbi:MAG: YhdP family protein [Pseudomonadota bacterium]
MPSSSPDTAPPSFERFELRHMSRRVVDWRAVARVGLWLVLVAWSLLLAAWLTLHWGILPHLDEWRPQIQQQASKALGVPVRIGRIEVQSRGWVPALKLTDVALVDAQGREALKLPQVAAAVSPRSLLAFSLRFEQLLIEGAHLDVRRDAQGRVFVAGLPMQGAAGEGSDAAADWFFEQHEFVIRHGSVRWTDERLQAPPLELTDVDLVVRNGLKRHAIRLDATPPAEWGRRFSLQGRFSQPLLAASGNWRRWSGTAHADLPQVDLHHLRRHVQLPFELSEGEGALRAWFDLEKGEPRGVTVDVALNAVALKLGAALQPLALQQVQGRLVARRDDQGMHLSAENFGFTMDDGRSWPRGKLYAAWTQRQDQPAAPVTGGEFGADRLDLQLTADIAERLPLGQAVRALLAQLQPQGEVQAVAARWNGPLDAPTHYQVKARFLGLSLASAAAPQPEAVGRPGLRNAQIDLRANESGGEATLALEDGALEFPGVFEDPVLPLQRLQAQLAWRIAPARRGTPGALPAIELKLRDVRFANADAEGTLQATWRTGAGSGFGVGGRFPGLLEMSGQLSRGEATSVARYLPLSIPAGTRQYVAAAVRSGQVEDAEFKVKGDLWQFPFHSAREGEFRIAGHVSGVEFAYVPPEGEAASAWPAFTQTSAELVFERSSMEIRGGQARVFGYGLTQVQGRIADLGHKPTLLIEGQGRGPLADLLRYVNTSPVGAWLEQGLAGAGAAGAADLKLALELPLDDLSHSTVKGSVALQGNELRLRPDIPGLAQARGRIDFTHKGFNLRGVSARALGGDTTLEGGTLADGSTRVTASGTATAEGLRRAAELPWLARMAASFSGQTPYRVAVGLDGGRSEIAITSPLTGLALDLPAPLRKSAETPLPLRVQTQRNQQDVQRDQLRVELGQVLQAHYQRDVSQDEPKVLGSALALGEPLPAPVAGGVARLNLGVFDADAWRLLVARWFANGQAVGAAGGGYVPERIALQAKELRLGGRRLDQVVATLSALRGADPGWHVNVVAAQLAGDVEVRAPTAASAGRVQARLSRLALPRTDEASVEDLLEQAPSSVPALDIVVEDFELRGKRLGRLEVEAVNLGEGGARVWQLAKLNLANADARLQASGRWGPSGAADARRRMVLDFKLDVADAGALLQRLGTPGALKGGKGRLQGQVAWAGSPMALDYPSLSGQLNLTLDKGQFLKAGTGAARLLSVLSLQSLPRRLVLDFRDLFEDGFAFDNASGDVQIQEGVASTNNLRMRGVQAVVLMEGRASIAAETQDLRVFVVPEINAGTASLAYAAINPAIGLGTFLAQMFLRKPLMQASTREFRVTGPWDDPKVERVERKPTDPLPNVDSAPTVAATPPPAAPPATR